MKKIVEINSVLNGSTGKIARQMAEKAVETGNEVMLCVPRGRHNKPIENTSYSLYLFGNRFSEDAHIILTRLTGHHGCYSYFATKQLLKKISKFNPDVIHLHNLHSSYINIPLLFEYIKNNNIKTVWTLHDCWAFTGQCPYFDLADCDKWKKGCNSCPQYRKYPQSYVDKTKIMWAKKKKWFLGVKDMTLVTPSCWLSDLVKQSFLSEYPIRVINNGIDLSVFKPTESGFRKKYGLENKKIVLGVAFDWGERKGLDVFCSLAERLGEDYGIVLVGTNDTVDTMLPKGIISIHRTNNQSELAQIYTAADVFANPTREENYPTVNMESIACGTPVVTFKTGGSPEIPDEHSGAVVECNDIEAFEKEIRRICGDNPFSTADCLQRANNFDMNSRLCEYIKLYGESI